MNNEIIKGQFYEKEIQLTKYYRRIYYRKNIKNKK